MGCNCGGRGSSAGARRTLYVLTTSDGRVKTYATEAEAKRVQGRLGGVVTTKTG